MRMGNDPNNKPFNVITHSVFYNLFFNIPFFITKRNIYSEQLHYLEGRQQIFRSSTVINAHSGMV